MLQFILGRAASGKSYQIIERIAAAAEKGEEPILIVPEQFSFESERRILSRLGDNMAQRVSVMSFSRLCDEAERRFGGACGKILSDSDKLILMNKAIRKSRLSLVKWGKYYSSEGFVKMLSDAVSEFKINAVSPQDLIAVSEKTDNLSLRDKLFDTATVYSEYDKILEHSFIDPSDSLTKLYNTLQSFDLFGGKTVFIDSFKGFTGQQFKIISCIFKTAENVTISLCEDIEDKRKYGIFSNVRATRLKLERLALNAGIKQIQSEVLDKNYYNSPELSALERLLSRGEKRYSEDAQNITICKAEGISDETEFVTRTIRKIVREEGARFSDFVIIARDPNVYEQSLELAAKRNGVNCFIDKRLPILYLPPVAVVLAAVSVAKSFSTESILKFHKSGVDLLSTEELSRLENYAFLWNIDGNLWTKAWDMDSKGFVYSDKPQTDDKELIEINALRERAIRPLVRFKNKFGGNCKSKVQAIIDLLDDISAAQSFLKLTNEYKNSGNSYLAQAIKLSWDKLMQIFESLNTCFGDEEPTAAEFYDALLSAVSLDSVGVIPQMVDEVTFGAADRIRPSRPKYAFILGANQGEFPRNQANSGIFGIAEREELIELGIEIPDNSIKSDIDEEFLVYSNVCCATDKLFICYHSSIDGSAAEPSAFVGSIIENLKCNSVAEPTSLCPDNLPETAENTFYSLCRRLSTDDADTATLLSAIKENDSYRARLESVISLKSRPKFNLSRETAHKLFGERLRMSPSKLDDYARCKFMYFCKHGLYAKRLEPAEFSAMQRGTMVHYVLQRLVEKFGKSLGELTQNEIYSEVDLAVSEYLDGIVGYRNIENGRMRYLVGNITRSVKEVACHLAAEFAQSDFEPVKCELRIGGDEMPEIKVPIDSLGELQLTGVVDRVDSYGGYVRIVDYKTGARDFKLPDILFGQNMQMLFYLYALCKSKVFGDTPAGIFYMPASRVRKEDKAKRRMHGIMLSDSDVIHAMDKNFDGEFIPTSRSKSSFITDEDFSKIFNFIEKKLEWTGREIMTGAISADPIDGIDSPACKYCDFKGVCRIGKEKPLAVPKLSNQEVISEIERQVEEDAR